MLNHYTMTSDGKKMPFVISHQVEVPFGFPGAGLYRYLQLTNQGVHCPDCGFWTTKVHEYHPKQVIAGCHNDTPIIDHFNHRRFVCDVCHHTFMEPLPWLKPYQRITVIGRQALLHATADRTFKAVGEAFGRSGQNVRVHVLEDFSQQPELSERSTPLLIGIDEISLAKGKGKYRLVMYDLSIPWRPQLFVMHESRRKDEVIKLLQELPQPERVLAVAIDMWRGYKTAVQTVLPDATVVIDAFHVIQASTKALGEVRKVVQKSLSKEQRDALKRDKDLFAEDFEELTKEQKEQLKQWEKTSPELSQAMHIHQKLHALYRCDDLEEALDLLIDWEKKILDSSLEPFQELLKTVWNWLPEILNRFHYRISNAKTEGKNNQVRTMNQQGFGYSINSLKARMQIKEEKTALLKWRKYQDRCNRRLNQNESRIAS
ncbi:ISL3 family transposase [Virgibacillus sp. 179-BFC.A HS]|uniref:ISL3 family transposase n=1 Tax=Tigheibacillus jepli TaxID=3035914 RepID=A0ABU5CEE4_9BACI|nr:ISL3 family transposase [Virgibacillus sp. 179-BFC.A HS]MDY0404706.1 ISL3 family transposase [Virgibacillus sp. 179-BFC.A HS]